MRNKIFGTGLVFLPVALVVIIADYLSKLYIINHLAPYDPQAWIEVIPGFFNIVHVHNNGAAFSFLAEAGGWQKVFFGFIAIAVSGYLLYKMYKNKPSSYCENICFALITGGALGNLYDRLVYSHVIDFLDFYLTWDNTRHHYPAFNIADCGVCVGVFVYMVYILFFHKNNEETK
ncbi:MAG: signal peptidase II [Ruminobacter sp.]|jgi:signal peptidase II|nr:signal peptidase II [Ruminobacter sp.]